MPLSIMNVARHYMIWKLSMKIGPTEVALESVAIKIKEGSTTM
jgi:hypothetical protein